MRYWELKKRFYEYLGIRLVNLEDLPPGISGVSPDIVIMDDLQKYTRGYAKPSLQSEIMEYLCKVPHTKCTESSTKKAPFTTGHVNTADYLDGFLRRSLVSRSAAVIEPLLTHSFTD